METLRTEKAALEAEIKRAVTSASKIKRELAACQAAGRQSHWAAERMENALLRERINDIAAEVARLAGTLEGPDSPIQKILAARDAGAAPPISAIVNRRHREGLGGSAGQPRPPHPRASGSAGRTYRKVPAGLNSADRRLTPRP